MPVDNVFEQRAKKVGSPKLGRFTATKGRSTIWKKLPTMLGGTLDQISSRPVSPRKKIEKKKRSIDHYSSRAHEAPPATRAVANTNTNRSQNGDPSMR